MIWDKLSLSCHSCNTKYIFKGLFKDKKYMEFGRTCPNCGGHLSVVPLTTYYLSAPPELKMKPSIIHEVIVK